jgi:hypothetical protein
MATEMNLITPDQFEIAYRRHENKLYAWLSENASWFIMAIACLALYGLTEITNSYFTAGQFKYFAVGAFVLVRLFCDGVWALLALALLAPFVPKRYQSLFQFYAAMTFAVFTAYTVYSGTDLLTYALGLTIIPFVMILSWIYLRASVGQVRWAPTIFYSLFFWALMGAAAYWIWLYYPEKLNRFWQLKPQFIWLSTLILVWQKKITDSETMYAFNPMNGFRGVLWPYDFGWEEERQERQKIWWNGYCNILLGYLILLFRIWLEKGPLESFRNTETLRVSGHLLTILSDVGALNLVSGTARLFGYGVRDATNFVFLARTPADIWRRSSTYNYLFVLRCVYMPLFRFSKNVFIISFISFLVFFINHHGLWNFLYIGLHITGIQPVESKFKLFKLAVFFLHFLMLFFLLYFTRRWWFFQWRDMGNPKIAWASVFLTHVLRIGARALSWNLAVLFFGS